MKNIETLILFTCWYLVGKNSESKERLYRFLAYPETISLLVSLLTNYNVLSFRTSYNRLSERICWCDLLLYATDLRDTVCQIRSTSTDKSIIFLCPKLNVNYDALFITIERHICVKVDMTFSNTYWKIFRSPSRWKQNKVKTISLAECDQICLYLLAKTSSGSLFHPIINDTNSSVHEMHWVKQTTSHLFLPAMHLNVVNQTFQCI